MKIAIISHTEHYLDSSGKITGWGPTVKEINNLASVSNSIIHIAPFYKESAPPSSLNYKSKKIKYLPLKNSGGKGLNKFSILLNAPYNLFVLYKALKDVDIIQFRAPTGIGIYVLPFLRLFYNSKYWVKYAGNWKDNNMPLGNKVQKLWLQNFISQDTKVTVNGNWENEKKNIISFENPCLDQLDRKLGSELVISKASKNTLNFCFVGALNRHKGVHLILDALSLLESDNQNIIFHFVGDGTERIDFEKIASSISVEIIFHGFLSKDSVRAIYTKCDFIILPSKSEGFPKVIGEAMNFGCIPIVSDISCISQYVKNNHNGFLIYNLNSLEIVRKIKNAILLNISIKQKMIKYNFKLSKKFTYSYYNQRIINEILQEN
ncbi:glycosyltransferase [Bacteroidia bacterium]|nr:glycosyltransferase [Bacteroidia bacterium]